MTGGFGIVLSGYVTERFAINSSVRREYSLVISNLVFEILAGFPKITIAILDLIP